MRATPTAIIIGLVSAALLPQVLPALQGAGYAVPLAAFIGGTLNVLSELGLATITDLLLRFVERMRKETKDGEEPSEEKVREQLEKTLLEHWQSGGEEAATLRQEASKLLQEIHGIEAALTAATEDVKQALAQGLAELGGSFEEFRWILDELKDTLAEIRNKQALQLAMQKEQLGLQREQLVKTNLLLRLQQLRTPVPTPVSPDVIKAEEEIPPADVPCPYKGLAAFEPEDADYFFGREELIAELTARLAETRFLGVVGPSGSGKSSVVRAGLLPTIWRDELPGSKDWKTIVLTPGEHPLEELAIRVALLSGVAPGSLLGDLEADERGLDLAVKQVLAQEQEQVRLVLIVDQFEELFTLCRDENERHRFIEALLTAVQAQDSRLILILAIRADFYGRCAAYPDLASKLQDNQVLVGAMSEDELRQAIERPASQVGLSLEPGLVETILHDVTDAPGALPLLSHALLETWNRRRGYTLTLDGYTETGGVQGAIARTADQVFDEQLSPDQQIIARNIFLRLTELGEGTEHTRRRVRHHELIPSSDEASVVETVLKSLADARLITTREETVEVAHEALVREWPKLQRWLDEDREGLHIHRRLTQAAKEWEGLGREKGLLYRGARLIQTTTWAEERSGEMNELEEEFLRASQVQKQRGRITMVTVVSLIFLILTSATFIYKNQASELEVALTEAQANSLAAIALNHLETRLDRALLLSIEGLQRDYNQQTQDSILSTLHHNPNLLQYLGGHTESVLSVVFSPDGNLIASGSGYPSNTIRLWNPQTGQQIGEPLTNHSGKINSVAFSPDGSLLASASNDDTIRLWDHSSGKQIGEPLTGHTDGVLSVAFSPDGSLLASGSDDKTIRLWDVSSGQQISEPLTGHTQMIRSVAFIPDGSLLASGSDDKTIRLWDVSSGQQLGEPLTGHTSYVSSVAFSPDGSLLASGSLDMTIRLWDPATGQQIGEPLTGHTSWIFSVAFSLDGSLLASGGADSTIHLWDVSSGQQVGEPLTGHTNWIMSVAFSPDGSLLASGSDDKTILLWDVSSGQQIGEPLTGRTLFVFSVAFSPDGSFLASGGGDGTVRLWDVSSGQQISEPLTGHSLWVNSVAFSPDGSLLASGSWDNTIRLWDPATGQQIGEPLTGHSYWVNSVAFSPDGSLLASGSSDETIRLWDPATGQQIGEPLTGHTDDVNSMAFSPDGSLLASGSSDNTIRLWNPSTGQQIGEPLTGHTDDVNSVAFSPDGTLLASEGCGLRDGFYCLEGEIRLWDPFTGEQIRFVDTGHTGGISSLAFSPAGSLLASGGVDNTIRLWDVSSGQQIGEPLTGHIHQVTSVAFSPDGSLLASGSADHTIRLWDPHLESLVERACQRAGRNLTQEEWELYLSGDEYRVTCPQWPIHPSVYDSLFGEGHRLAEEGDIESALGNYQEVQELYPEAEIRAIDWNQLCWFGSLWGYASEVMFACEKAVELVPSEGWVVDSRGLARALTGDIEGAIEDFQFYIKWAEGRRSGELIKKRQYWIEELEAGRNPFTEEVLEELKNE